MALTLGELLDTIEEALHQGQLPDTRSTVVTNLENDHLAVFVSEDGTIRLWAPA